MVSAKAFAKMWEPLQQNRGGGTGVIQARLQGTRFTHEQWIQHTPANCLADQVLCRIQMGDQVSRWNRMGSLTSLEQPLQGMQPSIS